MIIISVVSWFVLIWSILFFGFSVRFNLIISFSFLLLFFVFRQLCRSDIHLIRIFHSFLSTHTLSQHTIAPSLSCLPCICNVLDSISYTHHPARSISAEQSPFILNKAESEADIWLISFTYDKRGLTSNWVWKARQVAQKLPQYMDITNDDA